MGGSKCECERERECERRRQVSVNERQTIARGGRVGQPAETSGRLGCFYSIGCSLLLLQPELPDPLRPANLFHSLGRLQRAWRAGRSMASGGSVQLACRPAGQG